MAIKSFSSDQMRLILTVAKEGSFSRAAAALGVTQSAVSQSVKAVEEALGRRLLTRDARRVSPTQALDAPAALLDGGERVTLFCGRGCAGAREPVMRLAEALKAPIVHALGGKEHVEWDNPYDVGMTGLIGFSSAFGTLAASFLPYMVPFTITVRQAAAPPASLAFMFWGAGVIVLPLTLLYTAAVYWIFRGRVRDDDGRAQGEGVSAGRPAPGSVAPHRSGAAERAVGALSVGALVALSLRNVMRRRA